MACKCVAQEECHIIHLVMGRAHVCEPYLEKNKQSSCTSNMLTCFALLLFNISHTLEVQKFPNQPL